MKDLISVIVPVYNVQSYLEKCIDSILKQSYQNFEVILVDDGSTDLSGEICKSYCQIDKRIKLIKKENGGLSDARNVGILNAVGEFVAFVDSDDYIHEDYLRRLYDSTIKNNTDISVCSFFITTEQGVILEEVLTDDNEIVIGSKQLLKNMLKKDGYRYVVAWNKLYRKSLFDKVSFDVGKLYEDELLSFKLYYQDLSVSIVKEPLYFYVQRQGSIVQSTMNIHKIQMKQELNKNRIEFYNQKKDLELVKLAKKAYQRWIISVIAKDNELISPDYYAELQREFRCNFNLDKDDFFSLLQSLIGFINIGLAGKIKYIIKKGNIYY